MAFDERDPRDLKLHVLLLLLEHPQGISFGDFSGAFHQLHGYHPHISLYGYSSLRQLIADMKDLVVVEGSSGTPVMKFIKGLTLDNWPEVENGLQCSAEEPRCLMNGEKAEQQPVGLAEVLVALTNLLAEYKSGLRIKKLQEFLLARDGIDLEKFSINHGYKDTLEFLEAQMPELSILYQENQVKCVVQLMADASASSASATFQNSVEEPVSQAPALSDILAAVLKLLAKYKWGLKIKKLQDLLLAEGGIDLEKFSISHGNKDTLEFLEVQMPELNIQYKENHLSCVVMLPTEGLPDILAAVSNLLAKYKLGLKIKTLQELLLARDGIDLKKISITHGYKDTLEFLEAQMPELHIQYKANWLSCLVQLHTEDLSDTLAAITNILAKYKLGLKIKKLQELLLAEEGIDLEKFSISHGNKGTLQFLEVRMPELNIQYKENHLSCVVQLPADICVSSASSNVQNNGKEPAGQPPVPCIPVPSLESDSSACISNPAPSGQERLKTGTSSPAPCPGTVFPTCNSDAVSQKLMETKSGVPASSALEDIQKYVELPRRQAPELSVPFFLIRDILQGHPHGLRLKKLKKALNKNYKFNFETFCSDLGYKDVTSCLQDISGLLVRNVTKCKNCVVQLESRACSPAPSLDSDFSACCSDTTTSGLTRPEFGASSLAPHPDLCAFNADAVPQKPLATSSGLAEVLVALTNLLAAYKSGLRVTKLQEFLLARDGIDLEKFSLGHGYKDTLEFLEAQMTELRIYYQEDRLSSVIQLAADASASSASATIQNSVEEPVSQAPGASSLAPCPDFFAFNAGAVPQKPLATSPGLAEVLVALTNLLAAYISGLRVTKLQEFLLARDGIDLEKFSLSHGYKDTLEFLEAQMTELSIHYREDRLSSVIQLAADASASSASATIQNSVEEPVSQAPGASSLAPCPDFFAFNAGAVPQKPLATSPGLAEVLVALTNLLAAYISGLRVTKLQEFLLARDGIDLEKFSLSHGYKDTLEFLEAQMTELSIHYREDRLSSVIQLAADASASSASATIQNSVEEPVSQAPGASSLAPCPDFFAFNAGAVPQKPLATSPGLAEVLVALTNLLAAYISGLRVTKLQEFLLARDGIDLEKFSLSHGYKDTLEFLEAQMTELSIHYREDRLSSVIQLAAGCGDNAKPLSTSCHSSASKAQDQSLPLSASPTVENGVHKYRSVVQPPVLPSFDNPCITSHAKISSSHQCLCPGQAQPPKVCQLNGPLPPDEVSPQVDVEVPKISSLIKDQPAKDLEELKRQVAHILARHPEGMSLFQFRAAYSATYQQHLPLGNASSAKQCLLKMPDVVQLKGCGVQTLLLPVSLAAPPAKSGQPASSAVEKTPMVPGHTLPPTTAVAEAQMALRAILSKAPEVPQQSPISFLPPDHCREPGDQESCLLPRGQPPTATNPWQEHQRARAKAEDISGQPDWSRVEKASVDLAISVPKASLVGAHEPRLKPPAPNTAAMPMPQTPLSFLQVSELCRQTNSKECSSFSQPVPQKAPLPVYPMQEYVRTNPKPECNSFPPQSPVVFPTTPTSWDENLKPSSLDPKSTHLTNPWSLSHRAPATLASQPVSAGFQAWSQPVVYPPITFLSEMPAHPVTYPAPFIPTPVHPCQIQVPKSTLRSHPHAQKVTPKRPAQVMPPIHSTAQWTYIPAVPHSNIFQVPETSKTLPPSAVVFPAGWSPLSPPLRNTDASRSPKSQAVHQLACSNQDGLQGFSLPRANEKHPDTTLEGVTSKPPSPMYPRPYNNTVPLETSSSTLPISSFSLSSTKASLESPYGSSSTKKNSNSPLEPPAFLNQQQFTSGSSAPDTSDVRPAGSPPSLLDPTSSPHDQPLHPLSSITSNSDVHFSEPESFNDPQPYTSVSAVGTVSSTPSLSSPLCPVGSPSSPPRQPSSAAWKGGIDYGAPDQKNATPTIFNQTGSPPGPLSRRQTLPNPSPPVSPPSQSFDKCIIL